MLNKGLGRILSSVGSAVLAMSLAALVSQAQAGLPADPPGAARSPFVLRDSLGLGRPGGLVLVTSETVDRLRFEQLSSGVATGQSLLLRSASSLTSRSSSTTSEWEMRGIAPQILMVSNSGLPFSDNDGSLWAGKGVGTRTTVGVVLQHRLARLIIAPELVHASNSDWQLADYYRPTPPPDRSGGGFVFPYYIGPFSIDQPIRMGNRSITRLDLGQTSLVLTRSKVEYGFSSENEWWGPGIRNAIVLSNNAPGFPHLFIRTSHPLQTRLGAVEARWLVGGLVESGFFDTVSTNNLRSLASIAATLQTSFDPNLSFGIARSVYGTATRWGQIPTRWLNVFMNTGHVAPNQPKNSTQMPGGRDQIVSLFSRWVFPADGLELYTEWARNELPKSLRDFLVAPNHTQGYTLGLQWRTPASLRGSWRFQTEVTSLEQGPTFRDEPLGSWYTSRKVIQGYTNRGEVLGAFIGPGASSQWVAADYVTSDWRFGAFAGRIRWNEDFHSTFGFPTYVAYCNDDVSIYPGFRGAREGAFGVISAELTLQNRLNAFFENGGGCPNNGRRTDIRNNTLSVTYTPFHTR